ncbi:ChrR family anti-sigma-E factor [Shewanella sp. OMA3-2]|uniref:ChrR family anti-sigma-E factor n=1 Tax=Shewanella sp. OMA3-2 TaxID=2908650 RepID=UPI001F37EF18|nr:ChrR family anti-sigma-E factor [Shewanella sp. OMA3-2]UJF20653.1 ChrR family anti-sigma-E factor [Shewanella sp. OMA3-2]
MINYHPNQQLLLLHIKGELPLSMSLAISAHAELCDICHKSLSLLTKQQTIAVFSDKNITTGSTADIDMALLLEKMIDCTLDELDSTPSAPVDMGTIEVSVKGQSYTLPSAFRHQINAPWQGIGKISRLRLNTGEEKARASLLHIAANGEIPQHTHKGSELTLLLAGEFSDKFNSYKPGDFMLLDENHEHSPQTTTGCLCYTIVDAPLYFTKGFSKLLNPIGELLY